MSTRINHIWQNFIDRDRYGPAEVSSFIPNVNCMSKQPVYVCVCCRPWSKVGPIILSRCWPSACQLSLEGGTCFSSFAPQFHSPPFLHLAVFVVPSSSFRSLFSLLLSCFTSRLTYTRRKGGGREERHFSTCSIHLSPFTAAKCKTPSFFSLPSLEPKPCFVFLISLRLHLFKAHLLTQNASYCSWHCVCLLLVLVVLIHAANLNSEVFFKVKALSVPSVWTKPVMQRQHESRWDEK